MRGSDVQIDICDGSILVDCTVGRIRPQITQVRSGFWDIEVDTQFWLGMIASHLNPFGLTLFASQRQEKWGRVGRYASWSVRTFVAAMARQKKIKPLLDSVPSKAVSFSRLSATGNKVKRRSGFVQVASSVIPTAGPAEPTGGASTEHDVGGFGTLEEGSWNNDASVAPKNSVSCCPTRVQQFGC